MSRYFFVGVFAGEFMLLLCTTILYGNGKESDTFERYIAEIHIQDTGLVFHLDAKHVSKIIWVVCA